MLLTKHFIRQIQLFLSVLQHGWNNSNKHLVSKVYLFKNNNNNNNRRNSLVDEDDESDETGDVDGTGGGEEKPATCKDYMLHFISFFWKFLFAFVPPTSECLLNEIYRAFFSS